jgi:hypothetical protein
MAGERLSPDDEHPHRVGDHPAWNESRYVDVFDRRAGVGAWLRLGNRPNEGHAEMSVCVNLPDGTAAFMFDRSPITENDLAAGNQAWAIDEPFRTSRVSYEGDVLLLPDGWALTEPKVAFRESERAPCRLDLRSTAFGIESVMGWDQDHIDRIFLPGQADWHYQHLVRTAGTVRIGDRAWTIDGRGGRDHSWGPRNWHAKIYLRWLIAAVDDDFGFMLVRAVGPTKRTRSGFVWDGGTFHLVDDFAAENRYAGHPHHELLGVDVTIRSGTRRWTATATPQAWVPLRHVAPGDDGAPTILRIVKSPAIWDVEGRPGEGMLEYHDRMDGGRPVGLHD